MKTENHVNCSVLLKEEEEGRRRKKKEERRRKKKKKKEKKKKKKKKKKKGAGPTYSALQRNGVSPTSLGPRDRRAITEADNNYAASTHMTSPSHSRLQNYRS